MAQQVLEGTWEEIRAHDRELAGQHVRLTVVTPEWLYQPLQAPPVIYDPSSDIILTDEIRTVLDTFLDFLLSYVRQHTIPVSKVEIRGTEDPEGGRSQIMVRLWLTNCSDSERWRYFEDFCGHVDEWEKSLSEDRGTLFIQNIWIAPWRVKNA